MLILKEPIKLKILVPMVHALDGFGERIRGNYSLMQAEYRREELFHLMCQPTELYLQEGGMTTFAIQDRNEDDRQLRLSLVHNLLNRLIMADSIGLTYQDAVYVQIMLGKLGVKNVSEFMGQLCEIQEDAKNIKELSRLYETNKDYLRAIAQRVKEEERLEREHIDTRHVNKAHIETEHINTGRTETKHINAGHTEIEHINTGHIETEHINAGHTEIEHTNTGRTETEHINAGRTETEHINAGRTEIERTDIVPVYWIHDEIFTRLQSADLYHIAAAFQKNVLYGCSQIESGEAAMAEQVRTAEALKLKRLEHYVLVEKSPLISHRVNRYEKGTGEKTYLEEDMIRELAAAALLNLSESLFQTRFNLRQNHRGHWYQFQGGFGKILEHTLSRFQAYHFQQIRLGKQEKDSQYQKSVNEFRRQEIEMLTAFSQRNDFDAEENTRFLQEKIRTEEITRRLQEKLEREENTERLQEKIGREESTERLQEKIRTEEESIRFLQEEAGREESARFLPEKAGSRKRNLSFLQEEIKNVEENMRLLKEKTGNAEENMHFLKEKAENTEENTWFVQEKEGKAQKNTRLFQGEKPEAEGSLYHAPRENEFQASGGIKPEIPERILHHVTEENEFQTSGGIKPEMPERILHHVTGRDEIQILEEINQISQALENDMRDSPKTEEQTRMLKEEIQRLNEENKRKLEETRQKEEDKKSLDEIRLREENKRKLEETKLREEGKRKLEKIEDAAGMAQSILPIRIDRERTRKETLFFLEHPELADRYLSEESGRTGTWQEKPDRYLGEESGKIKILEGNPGRHLEEESNRTETWKGNSDREIAESENAGREQVAAHAQIEEAVKLEKIIKLLQETKERREKHAAFLKKFLHFRQETGQILLKEIETENLKEQLQSLSKLKTEKPQEYKEKVKEQTTQLGKFLEQTDHIRFFINPAITGQKEQSQILFSGQSLHFYHQEPQTAKVEIGKQKAEEILQIQSQPAIAEKQMQFQPAMARQQAEFQPAVAGQQAEFQPAIAEKQMQTQTMAAAQQMQTQAIAAAQQIHTQAEQWEKKNAQDITELVQRTMQQKINDISEQVCRKLERKLSNDRKRRGI